MHHSSLIRVGFISMNVSILLRETERKMCVCVVLSFFMLLLLCRCFCSLRGRRRLMRLMRQNERRGRKTTTSVDWLQLTCFLVKASILFCTVKKKVRILPFFSLFQNVSLPCTVSRLLILTLTHYVSSAAFLLSLVAQRSRCLQTCHVYWGTEEGEKK